MFQKVIRPLLRYLSPKIKAEDAFFKLHRYEKADGSFDYEKYKSIQVEGNKRKLNMVWVKEENIIFLSNFLKQEMEITPQSFGICHGTRRGLEQQWFQKHLGCEVIGTEISDTATQFPQTIQWDFHEVKPEWLNSVDFIYSNSFDHSFDPEKCINAWMSCLKPNGLCIIEHTSNHEVSSVTNLDPFGADLIAMPYLMVKWAQGKFGVQRILSLPQTTLTTVYAEKGGVNLRHLSFIVLRKFN